MPIKSYIVYPQKGEKQTLIAELKRINFCEVLAANNRDVLVLITDTDTLEQEEILEQKLKNIKTLQSLSMVAGYEFSNT